LCIGDEIAGEEQGKAHAEEYTAHQGACHNGYAAGEEQRIARFGFRSVHAMGLFVFRAAKIFRRPFQTKPLLFQGRGFEGREVD
jgi:hypothetical protein